MTDTMDFRGITPKWRNRFRRNVRRWYDRHARDLPWRKSSDPYRIWISEIMLQQTTVAAVVPYFERFLARFPNIEELAEAPEEEVLRHWEGLGYYSRARNIHKTARKLVGENGGEFPDDVQALQKLPGIGRYTGGAIASFAFDRRAPILEANTLRLYSRLLGYRGDPRSAAGQRLLWEFGERILPRKSPGRFNQALMELGGRVCRPNDPDCPACPVKSCCRAFAEGTQEQIPRPADRPKITAVTEATVAVSKGEAYLLRRRGDGERWAGLWDFPRFSVDGVRLPASLRNGASPRSQKIPRKLQQSLENGILETTGIAAEVESLVTEIRHGVTRYRIRLLCLLADYRSGSFDGREDLRWVTPREFSQYPLSVTGRKFARLLADE